METKLRSRPLEGAQRVPRRELELYIKRDFLTADVCDALIERIDRERRPSTLADDAGDAAFRTSETCDLARTDSIVADVEARIAAFLELDPIYGEPLQGQRYAVGQEFKAHTDYFEPLGPDFARYCAESGNRTWTAMIYLNEPAAGGATRFLAIDKIIRPETGKLLAWNNRTADGALNPATMHHGMKVRSGTKYIVTKWFRERAWPAPV